MHPPLRNSCLIEKKSHPKKGIKLVRCSLVLPWIDPVPILAAS
jgi:hypothetical protein